MREKAIDTLILSDLHLGSELSRASDALDLIGSLSFRRLVLLGDIFSDLDFSRLTRTHWHFLSHIRKLSNPKRRVEVVWVEGNHDEGLSNVMSHLVGIPVYQQYVWEYAGKRHLAIHGHQFDRFVVNNRPLCRPFELLYLQLQKWDAKRQLFVRHLDRLNTRWLRLCDKVAHGALGYSKQGKAERVFCGHTHVAEQRERDGVEYYNSGSWIEQPSTYITVGAEGVRIHDYHSQRSHDRDTGQEREPAAAAFAGISLPAGLQSHAAYESIRC